METSQGRTLRCRRSREPFVFGEQRPVQDRRADPRARESPNGAAPAGQPGHLEIAQVVAHVRFEAGAAGFDVQRIPWAVAGRRLCECGGQMPAGRLSD
ncbi:unnamed protein product, partial [Nesidiocoris tenuis]